MKLMLDRQYLKNNICTEFDENAANGLVADTRPQTDIQTDGRTERETDGRTDRQTDRQAGRHTYGRTWSSHKALFFLLRKEHHLQKLRNNSKYFPQTLHKLVHKISIAYCPLFILTFPCEEFVSCRGLCAFKYKYKHSSRIKNITSYN
jgi:hypothetical protein